MPNITYQLRDDGVLYDLGSNISALVRPKGTQTVAVEMWVDENITPIEKGDLQSGSFRAKLTGLAVEKFGEVNGLADQLAWIGSNFHKHAEERQQAAEGYFERKTTPELKGSPYVIENGGFARVRYAADGEVLEPLTNFLARIVRDVTEDDGAERVRRFEIEATLRGRTYSFEVPAALFAGMGWVTEQLGAKAVVYPTHAARDHARTAIQTYSGDPAEEVVYAHTGWREIGGRWTFLHAGGGISALDPAKPDHDGQAWSGEKEDLTTEEPRRNADNAGCGQVGQVLKVRTELHGANSFRELPEPPRGEERKAAIRASLGILEVGPATVTFPLFSTVYRAPLDETDYSNHLTGPTGEGKSELAALAQQHYGAGLDARHLTSWEATENALEMNAFVLKNQVFVIDDFNPVGSSYDVQRWQKKADRVLRAKGNASGRQRLRSDLTLRPEKPPRALIISTGEDTPVGQSLRARTLISELDKGELDFGVLTRCQEDAAAGLYASAMAGYVEYLSRDYAAIRANLQAARAELRAHAGRHGQHRRTTNIVADLALGLRYFLLYAMDCGAVGKGEAREIWARGWRTLCKVGDEQADQQAASEPTERFSELLRAAISGGMAHLSHATHADHVPGDPVGWGWRSGTVGGGEFEREEWRPQGTRLGWIREDGLYLQPDTALKLARDMGRDSSDPVSLTKTTLGKRMRDKGLLLSTGAVEGRESITVRRQFGGRRDAYLHVRVSYLSPGVEKPDQPDHEGQDAFRYRDSRGQVPDLEPDHDPEGAKKPDHDRDIDVEGRL